MTRARCASTVFMLMFSVVGDLLVQLAGDDEVHHFAFALGELFEAVRDGPVALAAGVIWLSSLQGADDA